MLNPEHLTEWATSAVSEEITKRNVWTITDPLEVDQLLNNNTDRRWKHSDHLAPGWAVAGVDPETGERWLLGAQYKPDTPPVTSEGKPIKYLSAKGYEVSPLFLDLHDGYWPALVKAPLSQPIIIHVQQRFG